MGLLTISDVMKCKNVTLRIKLTPQDENILKRKIVTCMSEQTLKPDLLHELLHDVDSIMCKQKSITSC